MLNEVSWIHVGGKEIILVGTAHVSEESSRVVREVIQKEQPEVVAVELCGQRCEALLDRKKWEEKDIYNVIREGKSYLFLMQLFLTNFQRKMGDEFKVKPGSEMLEAMNVAGENGARVALVDRDIRITLKRVMNQITLREKLRLFYELISGTMVDEKIDQDFLEKLKDKDVVNEMMRELSEKVPSLKRVLVDERDKYIAYNVEGLHARRIVAVVGAGHVEGIKKILESGIKPGKKRVEEFQRLENISSGISWWKILSYLVPFIFLAIMGWGFYRHGIGLTIEMFWMWFLINGSLSALGVLLASGHPLSIFTAFIAAPITSLNPAIAAGWVAGLVEAWIRKPRVKDFEGLFRMNSLRDYWGNRVTRIILVVAFANVGSTIATFIALPYLASLL